MTKGFIFWVIMLLWLLFGIWGLFPDRWSYAPVASTLMLFILIGLLGWKCFGSPVTD